MVAAEERSVLFSKRLPKSYSARLLAKINRTVPVLHANPDLRTASLAMDHGSQIEDDRSRFHLGSYWADAAGNRVEAPTISREPIHELSLESRVAGSDGSTASRLILGDNMEAMRCLLLSMQGQVATFYIDPPFNITGDGQTHLEVCYHNLSGLMVLQDEQVAAGTRSFNFWELMYERLVLARDLLRDDGSVFMHVNSKNSDRMGILMDEVFGANRRRGQIVRQLATPWNRDGGKTFPENHDVIFWYAKTFNYRFFLPRAEYDEEEIKRQYPLSDETGQYRLQPLTAPGTQEGGRPKMIGGEPVHPSTNKHWRFGQDRLNEMWQRGEIVVKNGRKGRTYYFKQYYNPERTGPISSIWTDVQQKSRPTTYPCWKSPPLLERLILSTTNADDVVGDLFCGSGLLSAVALKYRRRFIAFEYDRRGIVEAQRQLVLAQKGLQDLDLPYDGFETLKLV